MTAADVEIPSIARRAEALSQATAIEQARAVAEVAAQVRAAQELPRSMDRARTQMIQACNEYALAERAFYRVPNRGEGMTVHMARELARCFGNIQHGVIELHRDDEAGVSEVQAFAWDVENNTRSVRSFIVPHARMAGGKRQKLVDLGDIVNNNNNAGARAVRETIWHVLPVGFRKEAELLAREALERGNGTPLPERIANMVNAYQANDVTQAQLEAKVGKPRDEWTAEHVATLTVLWQSLGAGETTKDEEFPPAGAPPVTANEITGGDAAEAAVAANDPALDN